MIALNEMTPGSARGVFRPWGDRLNFEAPALLSNDDDPELLIHIPFNGTVKLRAICLIGEPALSQELTGSSTNQNEALYRHDFSQWTFTSTCVGEYVCGVSQPGR